MSTATQVWRPWLARAQALWQASVLPDFARWWGGQLLALLPVAWRGWFVSGAQWVALAPSADGWALRRVGQDQPLWQGDLGDGVRRAQMRDALHAVDPADLRLVLLLPADRLLRRRLNLPLAARSRLREVLAFEMDRQTPFRVAQVYYAARPLTVPAPAGQFALELLVVPRTALDPLLDETTAHGLPVDAVDVAAGNQRLGINLLPRERSVRHRRPQARRNALLAAIGVLALGLVLGQWLHNRRVALEQMRTQVAAMRGQAQQVADLRQQWQDNLGAAGFLAQRKRQSVAMLSVLREATARLPDGAWLERFSVDNTGQIGMQGQSPQASKLLDVLKASPLIADAGFQGSIQADPATGKERFYLVAQVRHPAAPPRAADDERARRDGGAP